VSEYKNNNLRIYYNMEQYNELKKKYEKEHIENMNVMYGITLRTTITEYEREILSNLINKRACQQVEHLYYIQKHLENTNEWEN